MSDASRGDDGGLPVGVWILMAIGACMLVVPCIGIAAAIAIPQFMKSVENAKQAESQEQLSRTVDNVQNYYQRTESIPGVGLTLRTTSEPPVDGEKVVTEPSGLSDEKRQLWETLGFPTGAPAYFQYVYEARDTAKGVRVTIKARADFEKGGKVHTTTRELVIENGQLKKRAPYTVNEGE